MTISHASRTTRVLLSAALLGGWPAAAWAQNTPDDVGPPCDGLRVTSIDIRPGRPPFTGTASRWRNAARAVGLHHATTRKGVINAFLALEVGGTCTEFRRSESERLVRDQPYIARSRVRTVPDGAGGVAVIVETIDEIPVLLGGSTRGLKIQSLSLGNGNIGGHGLLGRLQYESSEGFRTGYGTRLIEYATFGRPFVTTLEAFQHRRGYFANAEFARPFYTDLQRAAFHLGVSAAEDYVDVGRPARDRLALVVKQRRWDGSAIVRAFGTRTVTLFGVGASGIRLTPDSAGVVIGNGVLLPDSGVVLRNRYREFEATRVGLIGGLRRVNFEQVRGFDGLTATQNVASGVMTGLYGAHGIPSMGERDQFLSGGLYAGRATPRSLLAGVALLEGRRDPNAGADSSRWDSVIGSGRAALYLGQAPGIVFVLDNRYSTGTRSRLPLQLDLGDREGGILGYRNASLNGARRNALRAELRYSRERVMFNADIGVATFGETGTVWAGDAPYGVTATRSTAGVSILAAYPTRSKRLYRVDVGFPFTRRGSGAGGIEVRFSGEDRTNQFWREPEDVSRARTGPVPSALFVQPAYR